MCWLISIYRHEPYIGIGIDCSKKKDNRQSLLTLFVSSFCVRSPGEWRKPQMSAQICTLLLISYPFSILSHCHLSSTWWNDWIQEHNVSNVQCILPRRARSVWLGNVQTRNMKLRKWIYRWFYRNWSVKCHLLILGSNRSASIKNTSHQVIETEHIVDF